MDPDFSLSDMNRGLVRTGASRDWLDIADHFTVAGHLTRGVLDQSRIRGHYAGEGRASWTTETVAGPLDVGRAALGPTLRICSGTPCFAANS